MGVVRRVDQAFIGTCGFGQIDFARGVGDINYVLAKSYWGRATPLKRWPPCCSSAFANWACGGSRRRLSRTTSPPFASWPNWVYDTAKPEP
jgi:hypothetical protein